ncbi:hypothetical protein FKZ61_003515 [Litorilinea aerophila]|uniref:GerMN domain-containing protein n=1 Tax=Litorilinea aerophila TaxID=1204385 RepID=A0A540VL97_9CHLR|nr:hypothetical protein [Litorilinea aerophila]MCC9075182.1 hypothetical protein [Litorilinea aerophila]GIV78189.1 MAG: hypothetical protein KatS3mg050_2583 [Litorilinea sp.]
MQRKRLALWLSLLAIVAVVMAGCAPRPGAGETVAAAGPDGLAIDLPALVIDFDSTGAASIGNVPVKQLGDLFAPGMLDSLQMPPNVIQFLVDSNIQHIQINNVPSGLLLLVNGQPIPSLKWDGQSLTNTAELVNMLGAGVPALEKLLPTLTHIGVGVILRFPRAEGVAEIPTYIEGGGPAAQAAREAQERFLATVGTPPKINLPIVYEADGSWRVGDLTDTEWTNLTGLPWGALRLQPQMIQALMNANIQEITLSTDSRGIHVGINGKELPYIGWADGELNHVLDLAEQMGLWDTLADPNMNMGEIVATIESLLPVVQAAETNISVRFPAAMAAAR